MHKLYKEADDQNASYYVLYADSSDFEYLFVDKTLTIKATYEEVWHAFVKGMLVDVDGIKCIPLSIKEVKPLGAISYMEVSYIVYDELVCSRSSNIDITNLKELIEQLRARVESIESDNAEHQKLFRILVGLETKLIGG